MGAGTETGTGVETRGETKDGNGDGRGDRNESSSGDGNGGKYENGNGNEDRIGRAEERRRSARNRTRVVVDGNGGDLGGKRKTRRQERVGSVNPEDLENSKKAEHKVPRA